MFAGSAAAGVLAYPYISEDGETDIHYSKTDFNDRVV